MLFIDNTFNFIYNIKITRMGNSCGCLQNCFKAQSGNDGQQIVPYSGSKIMADEEESRQQLDNYHLKQQTRGKTIDELGINIQTNNKNGSDDPKGKIKLKPIIRSEKTKQEINTQQQPENSKKEQEKQEFKSNQPVTAYTLYSIQNQYPELFKKLRLQKFGDLTQSQKKVLLNYENDSVVLAKQYADKQDYATALNIYQTYAYLMKQVFNDDHSSKFAYVNRQIADISFKNKAYRKAIFHYQITIGLSNKESIANNQYSWGLTTIGNLGQAYFQILSYKDANAAFKQCLKMIQKKSGKKTLQYASMLNKKGLAQLHIGQYKKAISINEEIISIKNQLIGQDCPQIIINLGNKSNAYFFQKKYEQCLQNCNKAIEICQKNKVKDINYANILYLKAKSYFEMQKFEQAKDCLSEAGNVFFRLHQSTYVQILYKVLYCCKILNQPQEYNYYSNTLLKI